MAGKSEFTQIETRLAELTGLDPAEIENDR